MKNILLPITLLCVITFVIVFSCKKTNKNSTNGVTQSLNQLFSGLRTTPQSLNVTVGRDTIVYGIKGTILHFYSNSFKDANGNIITNGNVNMQLMEMYTPGDMVRNRATTMANGQILQSGGQVNIIATMNGQQVYANKYSIGFAQYNPSSQPMALFYGSNTNTDSVVTWSASDTTIQGNLSQYTILDTIWEYKTDSSSLSYVSPEYIFDSCINFKWINCDKFWSNNSPKTSVKVILPDNSYNANNTGLYLVLPAINSVLSNVQWGGSTSYNTSTHTLTLISESDTTIVPVGMNYEIAVITNKNGIYYYWQTSGVTTSGMTVTAVMAPSNQTDIVAKLQRL